jgi:hypothetical protein
LQRHQPGQVPQPAEVGRRKLAVLFGHFPDDNVATPHSALYLRNALLDTQLRKPVSVTYRTGLGHAETEIGKWRAETGAAEPTSPDLKVRDFPTRDSSAPA